MMILKIFTQPNCPNCPLAKALGEEIKKLRNKEIRVEFFNTSTVEGMAEGAFYQIMSTPTVLLCDDNGGIIEEWRGKTPKVSEVLSKI